MCQHLLHQWAFNVHSKIRITVPSELVNVWPAVLDTSA